MNAEGAWSAEELDAVRALDLEVSQTVSRYLGAPWPQEKPFVPTDENLESAKYDIARLSSAVSGLKDAFWREHFTGALESLGFQIECNTKMPYEHITRVSSGLDRLLGDSAEQSRLEKALEVSSLMSGAEAVVDAVGVLADRGTMLAKSQLADVLPALVGNLQRAFDFVRDNASSPGLRSDGERRGALAIAAAKRVQCQVKSVPVAELDRVDIPFETSVEKGMQAPLQYVLSWYDEDARKRRDDFFRIAEETFPGQDPAKVLEEGGGYDSFKSLAADMRSILDHLQIECRRFVDLPDGEWCDVGLIPETWRMMVPGFMYMDGVVAINPENLASFSRVGLETTAAHEVYPGHHVHRVKSSPHALPYTFRLPLFWSRCHQEGICDRSMALMTPYFRDPAARLSVAKRMWFTSNRVKAEVDIYYNKKPIQSVIDNYMVNLGLPKYNAHAQTRAHLMRPADAISYYTGMKYVEDLYQKSGADLKSFTNEVFSYGDVPLNTQKNILALSPEKKEQIRNFAVLKG